MNDGQPVASTKHPRPSNVRWQVFAVGSLTSWFLYIHRYAFSFVKSDIKEAYGLTNEDLGFLDAIFSVFYGGLQLPAGILVDLVGAHFFLTASIAVWSIGIGLHACSPYTSLLYAGRILLGSGQCGVFASLGWLTRRWYPAEIRTTIQGWMGVFFARFGGAVANILIGTVLIFAFGLGWQTAILVLASGGGALAVAFFFVVRNSPEEHPRVNEAERELIGKAYGDDDAAGKVTLWQLVTQCPPATLVSVLLLALAASFSTVADHIFSGWIPVFLQEGHGLGPEERGIFASLPLIGGAIGGVIGGMLNDRATRRFSRKTARRMMGAFGKGMAAVVMGVALFFTDRPYVFCGILCVVKIFADISLATRWGAITDMGGRFTASMFAFVNAFAVGFGILGSIAYGYMIPEKPEILEKTEVVASAIVESPETGNATANSSLLSSEDPSEEMIQARADYLDGWSPVLLLGLICYILCATCWLFVDCTKAVDRTIVDP
jgi:ACS family glucarate transporter-like MFS transporter